VTALSVSVATDSISDSEKKSRQCVTQILIFQIVTVFLASIAMSLAVAHALELPGTMGLGKENYIATQTIYYPNPSPKIEAKNLSVIIRAIRRL
jgi:hypothetical protein